MGISGPGSQLKHAVEKLTSQFFNLSPLDNTSTYQGIPVKNINLTTTLNGPQAQLELMVLVFLGDGTVTFGNETFRVQKGTMKFNIKVTFEDSFCVSLLKQFQCHRLSTGLRSRLLTLSPVGRLTLPSGVFRERGRGKWQPKVTISIRMRRVSESTKKLILNNSCRFSSGVA